ncbi:sugar 3,4-ketoisomerase [Marinomonas sp.]|uniref:sugar 3,4-ketoisomerase n=1 Tax=Marinomonas sp. TaxID=1904862 RepID=UPI003A93C6F9
MSISEHRVWGDERGMLVALESMIDVPFDIKRIFYIYGTHPELYRGNHSHYKTKQYLIAVNGTCKVTLDDGENKITYDLNTPNCGLLQEPLVWGVMHDFSPDCVLLVLASEHYDDADYIRSYSEFIQEVGK